MKVLITALLDPKDVPAHALAMGTVGSRLFSWSSTIESADLATLTEVLAEHAIKLSQAGGGKAEER